MRTDWTGIVDRLQYEWTGTQDWTPYFSITPAIAFRESIGGEDRIMRYCHTLAVQYVAGQFPLSAVLLMTDQGVEGD